MYQKIAIDRDKLTIMNVPFPNRETLNDTADAIGSNMFEGLEPTPKTIAIIRDFILDKITIEELIRLAKNKEYV